MSGLSAEAILAIWEQAPLIDDAVRGPLTILAHAWPDLSEDELLSMSVGERDTLLLQLRGQLFGEELTGFTHCPQCGERLEFTVSIRDIQTLDSPTDASDSFEFQTADLEARLRPPNSHDLLAAQRCTGPGEAARLLLECCVEVLEYRGQALPARELPVHLITAIGNRLSQRQGPADVALNIACDACSHTWDAQLDIAGYLHAELVHYARQLLDQVHTLAAVYGWQEQAILAMHPQRRQAYLERVLA